MEVSRKQGVVNYSKTFNGKKILIVHPKKLLNSSVFILSLLKISVIFDMEKKNHCPKKHFNSHFIDVYPFLSLPCQSILPLRCLLFCDLSLNSSYGFLT